MGKEDDTPKKRFEKLREGYKTGKEEIRHSSPDIRYNPSAAYDKVNQFLKDTRHWGDNEIRNAQSQPKFYASLAAQADELMKIGSLPEFKGGGGYLLKGAELYIRIGREDRAIKKLQQIAKADKEEGNFERYRILTDFVEKYETQHRRKRSNGGGLVEKLSSFIFLLAGLFFMALPDFTTTGGFIGIGSGSTISFFLSLGLIIIGGVLFFKSFKK
jgi:hypothetical protein